MTLGTAPPVHDLSLCIPDLKAKKREGALGEMVARAHEAGAVRDPDLLLDLLRVRERIGTTGLGKGVAAPHARSITILFPRLVVGRAPRGIDWGAEDELPVTLVLLTLAPAETPVDVYHGLVARAVAAARLQRNRQRLLSAVSFDAMAAVLREVAV